MSRVDETIARLFRLTQEEYGNIYEKKNKKDKIKCVICGGKYTRQMKKVHGMSKKHNFREKKLFEDIKKDLLYNVDTSKIGINFKKLQDIKNSSKKQKKIDNKKRGMNFKTMVKIQNSLKKLNIDQELKKMEELELKIMSEDISIIEDSPEIIEIEMDQLTNFMKNNIRIERSLSDNVLIGKNNY